MRLDIQIPYTDAHVRNFPDESCYMCLWPNDCQSLVDLLPHIINICADQESLYGIVIRPYIKIEATHDYIFPLAQASEMLSNVKAECYAFVGVSNTHSAIELAQRTRDADVEEEAECAQMLFPDPVLLINDNHMSIEVIGDRTSIHRTVRQLGFV